MSAGAELVVPEAAMFRTLLTFTPLIHHRSSPHVAFISALMESGVDFEAVDFSGQPTHNSHHGGGRRARGEGDFRTDEGGTAAAKRRIAAKQ
jgi:hypothetical protein